MVKVRSVPPAPTVVDEYAQLLALAAHEFRTPASVVAGYLRMLQRDADQPLSARQRRMVEDAVKACTQLVDLIGELSQISELDTDTVRTTLQTFDLFPELHVVAGRVDEGADREVRLLVRGMIAGARVHADRRALASAFETLYRALLREQPSATTIVVDCRIVADPVPSAVVVLAREDDVAQAAAAPTQPLDEKQGGIGLRLPIARRIIQHHGGDVWSAALEGEAGKYPRAIVVLLPLAR
jgi:signal transduction histidine kinase